MSIEPPKQPGDPSARRGGDLTGPPGPATLAAALGLLATEGAGCSPRRLVQVCVALRAVESLCAAARLTATVRLDRALQDAHVRPGSSEVPGRRAADELAAAWGIAPGAASRWVSLARRSEQGLPAAVDALAEGRFDLTRLRVLAEVTRGLPPAAQRCVEATALRRGPGCPVARLREDLCAEAQRCDPGWAARAAADGRAERDVVVRASSLPGCRRLVADLPAVSAQAAWNAVDAVATRARDRRLRGGAGHEDRRGVAGAGDDRTMGQLRADALTALLTGTHDPLDPSLVPSSAQLRTLAEVQVVVAADALDPSGSSPCGWGPPAGPPEPGPPTAGRSAPAGQSGPSNGSAAGPAGRGPGPAGRRTAPAGRRTGRAMPPGEPLGRDPAARSRRSLPATIPGAGPVDLTEARALAAATRWRRLVVDPLTGTLLAYGARAHPPPEEARDKLPDSERDAAKSAAAPATLTVDPRWAAIAADPVEPSRRADPARYVPPPALRRHVHSRDATCLGPTCHHTARGTELDHTIPFGRHDAEGVLGSTEAGNLGSLCRRAHNAKTHGGWTLQQPSEGSFRWTSPTGHQYDRAARPLLPGWTARPTGPAP